MKSARCLRWSLISACRLYLWFNTQLKIVLGDVLDVKYIAKFCPRLPRGELGLEKSASILEVDRVSSAYQDGSDSMLIALVYNKMR